MTTQPITSNDPSAEYFVPTAAWIADLKVGDLVPDCFGTLAPVAEIHARDIDINGKPFVCLYTVWHDTSRISGSFKADELHRSVKITGRHTSHELNMIEKGA